MRIGKLVLQHLKLLGVEEDAVNRGAALLPGGTRLRRDEEGCAFVVLMGVATLGRLGRLGCARLGRASAWCESVRNFERYNSRKSLPLA
jgi:hypothetical protein